MVMLKYFQKGTVILNKPNKKTRKNRILRVIVFFSEPELKTKEVQNVVLPSFWNFWHMFFTSHILAHSTLKKDTFWDYSL